MNIHELVAQLAAHDIDDPDVNPDTALRYFIYEAKRATAYIGDGGERLERLWAARDKAGLTNNQYDNACHHALGGCSGHITDTNWDNIVASATDHAKDTTP